MPERSTPEVPDLNARYQAERAMRDLTWGPGRTMPQVTQMTQPSYRDMSVHNAGRERDRMHDHVFYEQQEAAAPPVHEPFVQPETTFQPAQQQHRNEAAEALTAVAVTALIVAIAPLARRAAIRFRAMTGKQKAIVILGAVAIFTALLFA
jgi:hypothetical protein